MLKRWVERHRREITSGCIYISGAVEYDDRPGPIRDHLLEMVLAWKRALVRAAEQSVAAGHLRADTDCEQMIYEARALIFALHHDARFLRLDDAVSRTERAFERLITAHQTQLPISNPFNSAHPSNPAHATTIFSEGANPCPSIRHRYATCSSYFTKCSMSILYLKQLPAHAETGRELIDQVLEEGARFTTEVLLPINQSGDAEGCKLDTDKLMK